MIKIGKEGDEVKQGLNIQRISDGGVSFKLRIRNSMFVLRFRGPESEIKPKILFETVQLPKTNC